MFAIRLPPDLETQLPHLTLWQYRDFLGQWSKWLA